jgi:transcriptional regulator with XRE-family HTH domain
MAVAEISRIELGRRCPSLFTLACLAVGLEVDLSDLLATGQGEPAPDAALKAARKRRKVMTMNHMQGFVGVRVGFALKALRTAKGLSQTETAAFLGVDATSLSTWESSTRIPRLGRFYGLCATYGSTPYQALLPSLEDQSYANGQRSKFRA